MKRTHRQRGAALLLAMLTVALVATLSAAALWQQWRALAVESAERQRVQGSWILAGALDWARLILREDGISNNKEAADHLGEPWALPLAEARLSSFLAADRDQSADSTLEAFLSGDITDQQGRLNLRNLVTVAEGKPTPSEPDLAAFTRLFQQLGLPEAELARALRGLLAASDPSVAAQPGVPLLPTRWSQVGWLGLSPRSLLALTPHATWLPKRTALNLNTASAEALYAALPEIDMALARSMVEQRKSTHFSSRDNVRQRFPGVGAAVLQSERFDTVSSYFEVRGRLRLDDTVIEEVSLMERGTGGSAGMQVTPIWRERRAPALRHELSLQ
ncbi:MAG TPA: type II secretion system minor pseudopilin GspK [Burkholderiaceae bacterium]|nr:type II secretion system minor pseudopilin GspK [Burkholderiaceae bacterium]